MLKRESDAETAWKCGADLVVRNLEAQGVRHVFGIPGAKVDRVFDSLVDSSIETVVVRQHFANRHSGEVPAVRTRRGTYFLFGFRQRDIKNRLATLRSVAQELQRQRGLARSGLTLD